VRLDPKYVESSFIWSKILNWVLKFKLLTGDGDFERPQAHLMQRRLKASTDHWKP